MFEMVTNYLRHASSFQLQLSGDYGKDSDQLRETG